MGRRIFFTPFPRSACKFVLENLLCIVYFFSGDFGGSRSAFCLHEEVGHGFPRNVKIPRIHPAVAPETDRHQPCWCPVIPHHEHGQGECGEIVAAGTTRAVVQQISPVRRPDWKRGRPLAGRHQAESFEMCLGRGLSTGCIFLEHQTGVLHLSLWEIILQTGSHCMSVSPLARSIDRLIDCLCHAPIGYHLIDWLSVSCVDWSVIRSIDWLIDWLILLL